MEKFKLRQDRFEFFNTFENPLLNLTFTLETDDFISYCKQKSLPPFHFFLFHLLRSLHEVENFRYRILEGKVIKIEEITGSYTVLGRNNVFNFTRFENTSDMTEFIRRSLKAKEEAMAQEKLVNTGIELDPKTLRNFVFITSIPWLDFTSIQHPVFKYSQVDIPSIAWGKFREINGKISMPFSVQAHHGFVDAYHMHELAEVLKRRIQESIRS